MTTPRPAGGERRPPVPVTPKGPVSLLGRLQADIRADRKPPGPPLAGAEDPRPELDPADRSLQIHSCHGRARQVEVARDAVLHLLAADETLEPRDVIVMCPDIETFAPLIHAAFGPDDPVESPDSGITDPRSGPSGTGLPRLRVRLADRSVRQTNPLLGVAASLLDLAGARVTASEVLDLASRPPVARRFHFDQDDLSTLQQWVTDTGVRWGLDAPHRRPWALDHVEANTWATGLDRLLLGVTMAEGDGRMFAGTLPYDDVASSEVDLAGRLAELVERLSATLDQLRGPQPVASWVDALVAGTELLALSAPSERWQRDQAHRVLAEVAAAAAPAAAGSSLTGEAGPSAADGPALSLAEARELLGGRLQGRPTRANFRTGDLTVCTLVPMRSVPHRVVALLGLDDGAFPRRLETDGDDLLLASPRVGDRDARSEDRQLLLDALLAATEHLVITYSGHDDRTNRVRPPAVPVAELLDVVDQTVRRADERPADQQVVVEHPLQPFDTRNFRAGHPLRDQPWSYDRVHLAGSRAAARQTPVRPWLPEPLPPLDEPILQLDHLVRFVEHPVRAFLRNRLGLYLSDRSDEPVDGLPIELDALEKWGVGDRLLQACLAGTDPEVAAGAERARGFLPPGRVADDILTSITEEVRQLAGTITELGFAPGPADSLDIHLDLPAGRGLIGTVADRRGNTILVCAYSRLAPKHRLGALGAVPRAQRGAARTRRHGHHHRSRRGPKPGAAGREPRPARRYGSRTPAAGARTPRRRPRPLRPGHANAAAHGLHHLGRLGGGAPPGEGRRRGVQPGEREMGQRPLPRRKEQPRAPLRLGPRLSARLTQGRAPRRGRAGRRVGGLGDRSLWPAGVPPVVPASLPRTGPVHLMTDPGGPTLEPFDVCGALPTPGITVLEASAGTGKTFTISALIARFVAEGMPLSDVMAVTFTRMATGELRDRVRRRLVTAADHLARNLLAGEPVPAGDEVAAHLAKGAEPIVEAHGRRLADAVAAFDSATIATTHGFCQLVLDGLGSAGDVAANATLLEDPAGLIEEVVDDLYLRWCLRHGAPPFTRDAAQVAAAAAVANPGVALTPPDGLLTRLVAKARDEVARRLQDDNLLTYDHLLSRLADTLEDPQRGPLACRRLRQRYQVVLVDEFQDTDPVQWRIVRTAFGDGATILVLVGDPKQAIYSFRGADVHAYLDAARQARTLTLARNWRTDQPLLDATEALLSPLQMGDDAIRFRSVDAPAGAPAGRHPGLPGPDSDSHSPRRQQSPGHPPHALEGLVAEEFAQRLDRPRRRRRHRPADRR